MSIQETIENAHKTVRSYINEQDKANNVLYRVLGYATDLLYDAENGNGNWGTIRNIAEQHDIQCTDKSTKAHIIIRLVFKQLLTVLSDQQVYEYTKVIKLAVKHQKSGTNVPDWLRENGGINEVRRWSDPDNPNKKKGKGGGKPSPYTLEDLETYVTDLFEMPEPTNAPKTQGLPEGQIVAQLGRVDANGNVRVSETTPVNDNKSANALLSRPFKPDSAEKRTNGDASKHTSEDTTSDDQSDKPKAPVNVEVIAQELEPAE